MAKNATDVSAKWARNLAGSTESIRQGIQGVTESPTAAAARRGDAYVQGVQNAKESGKWQRGLQRVSKEDWQRAALEKGLPRIASGAAAAKGKMESFMGEFLPFVEGVAAQVRAMPKGTLADSVARATAQIEGNARFRRR